MKQKDYPFVSWLESLRENRAALAKLRRGLGKIFGTPEMYPYVVPFLPESKREQGHYFLVASLFALHPQSAQQGTSMGTVFRVLRKDTGDSVEKRFLILLSANAEDVGGHLRHAVSLAKSKGVEMDYHRLLRDLRYWDHDDRFVQLQWARDFWGDRNGTVNNERKGENPS